MASATNARDLLFIFPNQQPRLCFLHRKQSFWFPGYFLAMILVFQIGVILVFQILQYLKDNPSKKKKYIYI